MQIKIGCSCGQSYEFEVEPVNGAMPCSVVCPACGVDGTAAANQFISQQLAAAPAPAATAPAGLRIQRPAAPATPPSAEPVASPAAVAPAAPAAAPAPIQKRFTRALDPDREPPKVEANVPMGILGGVVAGAIAMGGWYALTIATEHEFGYVAWIVGVLVGIGVRIGAKEGTQMLGFTASVCAAVAILGGEFLVLNHSINDTFGPKMADILAKAAATQKEMAREGLNAKTDEEVKAWLVKYGELERAPTQEDIKDFRENRVPELKAMQDFKPVTPNITFSMRFAMFKNSIQPITYLWLIFGVISAWRLGSGGS